MNGALDPKHEFIKIRVHSTPGSAHQPCGPRGRLERGRISAEIKSIRSVMSAAMLLLQVPLGVGDSAALIALTNWRRRSGSAINRCRYESLTPASVEFGLGPKRSDEKEAVGGLV